ncbi:flagellar export chaperone FliS [Oceanobacillus alkalisoli]|uniref:flagellar export chaperone FliS n=1 Tax=Oceanobacillus alkalisoli TaxID=2925113 RepID=UPI001EF07F58|nr:flagellar export chaperone FliS [Oceanobacillus alkalisoli]MCF3943447.1 flagellar export chaperone FliS [Oceanobacillus alkalisoli]MCG5104036.1 flagellar export chaperone FliS [Oceanobacillus alkalisoli]
MNKAYQTYQNNSVNTASGGELTLMLYNGCIKFVKQAMKDVDAKDFEAKNKNIQKAQNIVRELLITLDSKVEISKQFQPLYEFMLTELTAANIDNSREKLEGVLELVTEFRDTWKQVLLQHRKRQYSERPTV